MTESTSPLNNRRVPRGPVQGAQILVLTALIAFALPARAETSPDRRIQLFTSTANGFDYGRPTRDLERACRQHGTTLDVDATPTIYRPQWLGPALVTGWCQPPPDGTKIVPPIDLWIDAEPATWYGPTPAHFEAFSNLQRTCEELGGHLAGTDATYLDNSWKFLWTTAIIAGHCRAGSAR